MTMFIGFPGGFSVQNKGTTSLIAKADDYKHNRF